MYASRRPRIVVYAALAAAIVGLSAGPARAQFQPRPLGDPATGEDFHVEGFAGFWFPRAQIVISSESLGIIGSTIDVKKDLGLVDQHFGDLRLVLRPAPKHKFRFERISINYDQSATLTRDVIFNGQRYRLGIPVDSSIKWRAYRFGYEYDFIRRERGFGGFIVEAKYTDVTATLANQFVTEIAHAQAPIPALGGIVRVYPVPNIGITFELTAFKLPQSINENYKASYVDPDLYGTLNFNRYVGAQVGYRSLDLDYHINNDNGTLTLKGLYFGIVARY